MPTRRGQSSSAATAGELLAARSVSNREPAAQNSVTMQAGAAQTPRNCTTFG